jgi:hypothetical protein
MVGDQQLSQVPGMTSIRKDLSQSAIRYFTQFISAKGVTAD